MLKIILASQLHEKLEEPSFEISSKDGFEIVYELKNGQKSLILKRSCLCLNHNQAIHFIQSLNTMIFCSFIKSSKVMSLIVRSFILFYQQTLSHFFGGRCRYYPSCSHYAAESFEKFTFFVAVKLVFKRLASCHPLSRKPHFDPVPSSFQEMSLP